MYVHMDKAEELFYLLLTEIIFCIERQRCDAVRTDPLFLDFNGHAFWKLKASGGESDILLQGWSNCCL